MKSTAKTGDNPQSEVEILRARVAELERVEAESAQMVEALRESEERFDLAVRGTSDGLWDWNIGTGNEWWSPRFRELIGYTDDDLPATYQSWISLLHPDDRDRTQQAVSRHLENGEAYDIEYRMRTKNQGYRWFLARGVVGRDETGKPKHMAGSIQDITDRKLAEDALCERESLLSNVFASIQDGISILDTELNIVWVNRTMEQWYAHTMPLAGKKCHEAYHERSAPCEVCPTQRTLATRQACYEEIPKRGPGGEIVGWLELYSFPFEDEETHQLKGVIEYVRDITDRKRAEEEKEKLEDQLRHAQKMEAVGQLAGGVAHDFNNVLTVILGNAELLFPMMDRGLDESSTEVVKSGLEQIKLAGQRAAVLTRQLLAFSRKEMTRMELLDLRRVIGNTEEMLRRLLREDIMFDVHVAPEVRRIRADAGQIEQVIMNLVLNAHDAMPEGGTLTVTCVNADVDEAHAAANVGAKFGPHVMLAVSDTGIGMSRETMDHMFEPFFTTKPRGKGTGLGLATVYGIVRQMGAHTSVESELGRGSTFRIYFPAVREEAAMADASTSVEQCGGDEVVLICEDEDSVRRVACQVLRAAGYTILEAENGKRALDIVADHDGKIDLLISDIIMPGMNGKELAEAMRKSHAGIRVMFISGYTDDVLDSTGYESEGKVFLQKPFRMTALLRSVRDLLDES